MNVVVKVSGEDGLINRLVSLLSENDITIVEIYDESARTPAPKTAAVNYGTSAANAISAAVKREQG